MASGRGTTLSFYPFLNHYVLLGTWVVAVIAWFTAFIAMCVGEAHKSAVISAVTSIPVYSTLWFAIFLQLAVMAGFFIAIATDSLPLYQLQLSIFGAVALVFAVGGVNNIFSNDSTDQAVGAGWLLLAMVDIIWLLFLTSEKPTLFNHVLNHPAISHGNQLVHPSGNRGFSGSPSGAGGSFGGGGSGAGGGYNGAKRERSSSIAEMNPSHNSGGNTNGGYYAGGGLGGGLGAGISSEHLRAEHSPLVGHQNGETQSAMSTTGGTAPGGTSFKRAKALYAYQASPDDPQEISMTKGEIFDVLDNSGKWWQVVRVDGSGAVGISPSNYLQLL